MVMNATVIESNPQNLLVRDDETGEEVLVITEDANLFSPGDNISITYNGQMTLSIPPQIAAMSIQLLTPIEPTPPSPPPTPSEFRGVVLRIGNGFLLAWNVQDRRPIRVDFPYVRHFCVQQTILVRYDTIKMTNPPTVTATDITPIC